MDRKTGLAVPLEAFGVAIIVFLHILKYVCHDQALTRQGVEGIWLTTSSAACHQ
jgi:hypothetical protein